MKIKLFVLALSLCFINSISARADEANSDGATVNGADVGDFLGTGPVIDRDALDKAAKAQQKFSDLDLNSPYPAFSGQHREATDKNAAGFNNAADKSQNDSSQNDQSQSNQSNEKHKRAGVIGGIKKLESEITKATEKVGNELGYPVGPDDENKDSKDDF